jgi:hypothetical protein
VNSGREKDRRDKTEGRDERIAAECRYEVLGDMKATKNCNSGLKSTMTD